MAAADAEIGQNQAWKTTEFLFLSFVWCYKSFLFPFAGLALRCLCTGAISLLLSLGGCRRQDTSDFASH